MDGQPLPLSFFPDNLDPRLGTVLVPLLFDARRDDAFQNDLLIIVGVGHRAPRKPDRWLLDLPFGLPSRPTAVTDATSEGIHGAAQRVPITDIEDRALEPLADHCKWCGHLPAAAGPQCGGPIAVCLGLDNFADDREMLKQGMVIYHALCTCHRTHAESHH
jgi:hypothetical protein